MDGLKSSRSQNISSHNSTNATSTATHKNLQSHRVNGGSDAKSYLHSAISDQKQNTDRLKGIKVNQFDTGAAQRIVA